MLAYRQMDDRSTEPMLPDLLAAVRRGEPRHGSGVLIAVEGAPGRGDHRAGRPAGRRACGRPGTPSSSPTAATATGSAGPRPPGRRRCPGPGRRRWPRRRCAPTRSSGSSGRRWPTARWWSSTGSWPARWSQFGVAADRGAAPSSTPASWTASPLWATGRLRPDVSVLLDRAAGRRRAPPRRRAARRGARPGAAAAHPDGRRRAAPLRGRRRRRRPGRGGRARLRRRCSRCCRSRAPAGGRRPGRRRPRVAAP